MPFWSFNVNLMPLPVIYRRTRHHQTIISPYCICHVYNWKCWIDCSLRQCLRRYTEYWKFQVHIMHMCSSAWLVVRTYLCATFEKPAWKLRLKNGTNCGTVAQHTKPNLRQRIVRSYCFPFKLFLRDPFGVTLRCFGRLETSNPNKGNMDRERCWEILSN